MGEWVYSQIMGEKRRRLSYRSAVMNIHTVITDDPGLMISTIGCAILLFFPFSKKRIRAGWAKWTFLICGVVGTMNGVVQMAWDLGCFVLRGTGAQLLHRYFSVADGIIIGFLLSLALSGELAGKKRLPDVMVEPSPPTTEA